MSMVTDLALVANLARPYARNLLILAYSPIDSQGTLCIQLFQNSLIYF